MTNMNFTLYLLTVVFGAVTMLVSAFSLGAIVVFGMSIIWMVAAIVLMGIGIYTAWQSSQELFQFIRRHGIS